jgi:hypothetical protein
LIKLQDDPGGGIVLQGQPFEMAEYSSVFSAEIKYQFKVEPIWYGTHQILKLMKPNASLDLAK